MGREALLSATLSGTGPQNIKYKYKQIFPNAAFKNFLLKTDLSFFLEGKK
jgi:hypothetical protein